MLDHVAVFSTSGVVLWSRTLTPLKGAPVNALIHTVLLEGKAGGSVFLHDNYAVRWSLANDFGLVVVAVYQKVLPLQYVEGLLAKIKRDFTVRYGSQLRQPAAEKLDFDRQFDKLLREAEGAPAPPRDVRPQRSAQHPAQQEEAGDDVQDAAAEEDAAAAAAAPSTGGGALDAAAMEAARARLAARAGNKGGRRRASGGSAAPTNTPTSTPAPEEASRKRMAAPTKGGGRATGRQLAALDRSRKEDDGGAAAAAEEAAFQRDAATYVPEDGETPQWAENDSDSDDGDDDGNGAAASVLAAAAAARGGWRGTWLGGAVSALVGGGALSEGDLAPALDDMRRRLMDRNVAAEVADEICRSVGASLRDQKRASFTRVKTVVQAALKEAIMRILMPQKSTDLLRAVLAARDAGTVYSAVFVGINGVGKSTSLAKVAYYLKTSGVDVMLAACDTYRSGAVEQLRVHARCLGVPLFEMGYAKDPSAVAAAALRHAREQRHECVLIDTAGRMQNNKPLMTALGRLVADNAPDLCLFVGEALVGNDGIDQVAMFNEALASASAAGAANTRQIDGIILTKFDTVDLKVGAALSMCYHTGQPIVFVGTGQKYSHLRRLNASFVVKALFS
ncbi:signal recognition particle receptor subunit alpha [Tribonema minus]|uniref:Signal recognition particle receptor subunit alpha n=1 Tax=Tribonema minus TaxID=303371 RepID=A0A836CAH5_9STRA|nr:signal recognition particle receptor subunit alpha [Tribonema minus]